MQENGPVGPTCPHLILTKENPPGQKAPPMDITQQEPNQRAREMKGRNSPVCIHSSWNALVKRFNSNNHQCFHGICMLSQLLKTSGVSGTLLLCSAENPQNDQTHKERLKTRFITALDCSCILLFLMYVSPRASYDTVAKPAIKRAALCFQCEEAVTTTEMRAGRGWMWEMEMGGAHGTGPENLAIRQKKNSLFKTPWIHLLLCKSRMIYISYFNKT